MVIVSAVVVPVVVVSAVVVPAVVVSGVAVSAVVASAVVVSVVVVPVVFVSVPGKYSISNTFKRQEPPHSSFKSPLHGLLHSSGSVGINLSSVFPQKHPSPFSSPAYLKGPSSYIWILE